VREVLKGLGRFDQEGGYFVPALSQPYQERSYEQMKADVEWSDATENYPDVINNVTYDNRPPHVILGGKIRFLNATLEIDRAIAFAVPDYSTAEKRMAAARVWIEGAIAAGHRPYLRQCLEQGKKPDVTMWLETSKDNLNPKPDCLPSQIYDEAFAICEELGEMRYTHKGEMPWHSNFKPGDYSGSAFGERLKLIRKTLRIDLESFYEPVGVTLQTALKWEAGQRPLKRPILWDKYTCEWERILGVPCRWLCAGEAYDKRSSISSRSSAIESDETQAAA
jgi:hypothetical protein